MSPRSILVTAFQPFGGRAENSSLWVLESLWRRRPADIQVDLAELPVVYDLAARRVLEALGEADYDEVMMLGMAGPEQVVRLESDARNRDDSAAADNAGAVRQGAAIEEGAAEAICPAYPRDEFLRFLKWRGFSPVISRDAGGFVCNNTYYRVAHALASGDDPFTAPRCIFVHVPAPGRGGNEGWKREDASLFANALIEWFRTS